MAKKYLNVYLNQQTVETVKQIAEQKHWKLNATIEQAIERLAAEVLVHANTVPNSK